MRAGQNTRLSSLALDQEMPSVPLEKCIQLLGLRRYRKGRSVRPGKNLADRLLEFVTAARIVGNVP